MTSLSGCHHIFKQHDTLQDNTTQTTSFYPCEHYIPSTNKAIIPRDFPRTIKDWNTLPHHYRKFLIYNCLTAPSTEALFH